MTNAQWDECVDQGECNHRPKTYPYTRPDHPVSGVNWFDAQQYLLWLSKATGKPYRLPTEHEWKQLAADVLVQQDAKKKLFDDPRMEWARISVLFPTGSQANADSRTLWRKFGRHCRLGR